LLFGLQKYQMTSDAMRTKAPPRLELLPIRHGRATRSPAPAVLT
jgi:hypothetical protein